MSFQDFGKKGAGRPATTNSRTAAVNRLGAQGGTSGMAATRGDDFASVSQAILQYQVCMIFN